MRCWFLLLALAACEQPRPDAHVLLEALTASPAQAHALCGELSGTQARDECLTDAASRGARLGGISALPWCDGVSEGPLRDECRFAVVDAAHLLGQAGIDACAGAGSFERQCLTHALHREVMALPPSLTAIGQEHRLVPALEAMAREWAPRIADRPERLATQHLMVVVGRRGRADKRAPFDPAACGVLDAERCGDVYWALQPRNVKAGDALTAICQGPLTRERLGQRGAVAWTPGADTFGTGVWTARCARHARLRKR